jgi:4-amino-4-deoxy-L-arabinose transferase-like glycosyltransferase
MVVACLCGFLFFYRLGERDLTSSHEARAAQNAQSIVSDGAWALPRLFNQRVDLQKPPLYYWLVALLAWTRDGVVDPWTVRLPAALSACGCVLFLYLVGYCRGRPLAGFLAAVILATSVHFTWLGRVGRIDMPLTLTICLALGGFHLGTCRGREGGHAWPWLLLGYLAVAAGLMLKGPIAAVLPVVVAGTWRLVERGKRPSRSRSSLWWGIPLVLAIAAPWFVWADIRTNHELFRTFFWYHNVERGLGGTTTLASHPWWFYGPRLLIDFLPWSVLLPIAGWYFCKLSLSPGAGEGADTDARFGLVWLLAMVGVLSLMSFKRGDYLLPAYPGASLWLGCVAERWLRERGQSHNAAARLLRYASALGIASIFVGWWVYLDYVEPARERARPYRRLAAEIRRRTREPVIFFRTEAHELAFHVGRPLDTIRDWENLDVWTSSATPIYVVMPPDCARDWPQFLQRGRLRVVTCTDNLVENANDRPLVVLCSVPPER